MTVAAEQIDQPNIFDQPNILINPALSCAQKQFALMSLLTGIQKPLSAVTNYAVA